MDSLVTLALPGFQMLSHCNHCNSVLNTDVGIFSFSTICAASVLVQKPNILLKYSGQLLGKLCCVAKS